MIAIALWVLIPSLVYALWRAFPFSQEQRHGYAGVWRLACVIAVVRISVFGTGAALMHSADWRQSVGYMLVLAGFPEIYAARALRHEPAAWLATCCLLLAASSLLWAAFFRSPYRMMRQANERPKRQL